MALVSFVAFVRWAPCASDSYTALSLGRESGVKMSKRQAGDVPEESGHSPRICRAQRQQQYFFSERLQEDVYITSIVEQTAAS